MAMTSLLVDGALDSFLRGSLGGSSVWAEGNTEIDDLASADVVDETYWGGRVNLVQIREIGSVEREKGRLTVDVNRLEGSVSVSSTTTSRG
jgi:hypothetical protein